MMNGADEDCMRISSMTPLTMVAERKNTPLLQLFFEEGTDMTPFSLVIKAAFGYQDN